MQRHHLGFAISGLLLFSGFVMAQSPGRAPQTGRPPESPNSQAAPGPDQLTPQVLAEMLRSATTFHDLVRSMNLNKSLGPDQHVQGPDGRLHHPLERTAETMGAGAGAGAAIGAMTHSQNGVLIGALVGGAGGLIIDQILKHREELKERPGYGPVPDTSDFSDRSRGLKNRSRDQDRH